MPKYSYVAMDAHGKETKGSLEVASQNEAIGRVKEMGLFPTKIVEVDKVKDKSGKAVRLYGTVWNITERKEAEQALQASRQSLRETLAGLEERVAERTRELAVARDAAAARLCQSRRAAERSVASVLAPVRGR